MNAHQETTKMDVKVKLSTLWILVMFNMAFADIFSFMLEWAAGHTPEVQVSQGVMLVFAVLIEIPIAMILLSRVLPYRANRWANIIAAAVTTLFVIGGGSTYLHYIFFAAVEVGCMLLIVSYAWKWPNPEGEP